MSKEVCAEEKRLAESQSGFDVGLGEDAADEVVLRLGGVIPADIIIAEA